LSPQETVQPENQAMTANTNAMEHLRTAFARSWARTETRPNGHHEP